MNGAAIDIQSLLSKLPGLPWSKYPGEKHLPNYQYCGPGTRLDIRLDANGNPKPGEEPINKIDKICLNHDKDYQLAGDDLSLKHQADRIMLQMLDSITDPTIRERVERLIVKTALKSKLFLGVGFNPETNRAQLADELHKTYRKPPQLLKVKVPHKDHTWSSDLVFMPPEFQGRNGKYKYIITVLDIYTRYAWALPLKTKNASEVKEAFEKIFRESERKPTKLWVDRGTEYYNKTMDSFLKDNNIILYSTDNESNMCERLNRSLKTIMWKIFTINGHQR